jgi:hypothetical protein
MTGLTEPERLALAYIVDEERKAIRRTDIRDKLPGLIGRLADVGNPIELSPAERHDWLTARGGKSRQTDIRLRLI